MATTDDQPLDREPLRQIYRLITERDGADISTLREGDIDLESDSIEQHVRTLTENGFLAEEDGQLYMSIPTEWTDTDDHGDTEETIRVAREGDLPGIEDVIEEVTAERTYVEAETVSEELDRDDSLVRFDDEKTRVFFVTEIDGEIVAWLDIEAPEREKLKHTARFTVGVSEEYRGRGIGKRLMTCGLAWAEAHGYHKVYNDFPATNRGALAFLDTLDYDAHCEAVHRDHYLIDDEFVDQMALAVYLSGSPDTLTHFDRVQQEAEEIY